MVIAGQRTACTHNGGLNRNSTQNAKPITIAPKHHDDADRPGITGIRPHRIPIRKPDKPVCNVNRPVNSLPFPHRGHRQRKRCLKKRDLLVGHQERRYSAAIWPAPYQ